MGRPDISPTRTNLRKVSADLEFAMEGFDLLDQKRELLVMEIMKLMKQAREAETTFQKCLYDYYGYYRSAALFSGRERVARTALQEPWHAGLKSETVRAVGINLTHIGIEISRRREGAALMVESSAVAAMVRNVPELLRAVVHYASLISSIFKLSRELKSVQRRVNALEKIFIPKCRESKKYITERLEEMEREEIYVKKMIGERHDGNE